MSEAVTSRGLIARESATEASEWSAASADIVVGKDILELLSSSMYVDPMTIYREYTQNSADAIDEARANGLLSSRASGRVSISINPVGRVIRIRDNGTGIPWSDFCQRLSSLGASKKRGTEARGFRGVGRLAGLGYCQELIFRSRASTEKLVSEMRWDCRVLKSALRSANNSQRLAEIVQSIVSARRVPANDYPDHFFEVELKGVIRHRDDRLLNPVAVAEYLSQVAPVPFSPEFTFASEIEAALAPHVNLANLDIRINDSESPIFRPHRNSVPLNEVAMDKTTQLEIAALNDVDGNVAAIAWVAHHGYYGALPAKALVKGIRLRSGNVQVGDNNLLEGMFSETRFNAWAIAEVHVVDKKVLPNGRRDHFEHSAHLDNLLNQLTPLIREIARRCRDSSIARKWVREFDTHKQAVLDETKVVRRGGLSKTALKSRSDSIAKSLKAIDKIVATRHIDEETRKELSEKAAALHASAMRVLKGEASEVDPLEHFRPVEQRLYRNVISLIYECSANRAAAISLVDKLLTRLGTTNLSKTTKKQKTTSNPRSRKIANKLGRRSAKR
jgi:hypothetical protein